MRPYYRFAYKLVESITLGLFHTRIKGQEHVPAGGCLVVSNHVSFLDPTTIGWALGRETYFLARKTLFKPPLLNWFLPICNVLPLDRDGNDSSGLRQIIKRLKGGQIILLFPEGTRSPDGHLQKPHAGAGFIAAKAGVPILPVRIFGTYESYSRFRRIPRIYPLRVVIGQPFFADQNSLQKSNEGRVTYEQLAINMMKEIEKLQ